jgi:patatin-like phospholipase/acyl hydrolase
MVDKKIRVLVLDDGGVQVLSQLRILQHILANVESNHGDATKPCEYFDLIVGSGLGGLLALLLGKFQQVGFSLERKVYGLTILF